MSETGFRQEQKSVERPKPSPRAPNKSPDWSSSPPSPGNVGQVQIVPESKPGPKPVKPQRNFTVRYDPQSRNDASNDGSQTEPKRSVSPENTTQSTARPVPRPRPRSMIVSRSEPMCISAAQNDAKTDKLPAAVRPEPATRSTPPVTKPVAPKGPKGYHVVGSSTWYDGSANAPPLRPPPVKPKPLVSPTGSEPNKTAEDVQQLASTKIPPDVVRRKPTIIRPTPLSSVEQTVGPPASTTASPLQSVTATASSTPAVSGAETNGWSKPVPTVRQSASDTLDHADVSEAGKPQAKKRPTIIKRTRPDTVCTSELSSVSADQKPSQAVSHGSVEVSHSDVAVQGFGSSKAAVVDLQRSEDSGSLTALGGLAVSEHSEAHDLKPLPRSQSQPLQSAEQELNRKIPPSKPPPPRLSNTAEEQKATV